MATNKDKEHNPVIDEVLAEIPPDINEPVEKELEESEIVADALPDPENEEPKDEESIIVEEEIVDSEEEPVIVKGKEPIETPEQKEQRYKAQQTEAQIQAERNKALTDKVEEAANVTATEEELRAFVQQDGVNWDELTNFEQSMARKTFLSEKKFNLVHESVQTARKVDEWAKVVDDFIDTTDGKPEFVDLSGYEADFRKFAMKEAHRGSPIDVLLGAFLHNLPPIKKNRGSLFNHGGGGEKDQPKQGITDADTVSQLRQSNPKEYARQLKLGKIKIEI